MSAMTQPTSPLDRPLTVTFFKNFGASEKQETRTSLRNLMPRIVNTSRDTKDRLPWLKLARFGNKRTPKNSLRHDGNVLGISGVEGDYDHEIMTMDEALAILRSAGIAALVYTSPSHTEDTPRWRVLCPLSQDYDPPEHARFVARLNGLFQGSLSRESFALSQSYYYGSVKRSPSHRAEVLDGDALDLRADLDGNAIGRPNKDETRPVSAPTTRTDNAGPYCQAVLRSALERVRNAADGTKHHTLRDQARLLGGFAHAGGWSRDNIVEQLLGALSSSVKDWKAARTTAEWGFDAGVAAPLEVPERDNVVPFRAPEPPPLEAYDEPSPDDDVEHMPPVKEPPVYIYDPWNTLQPVPFPLETLPEPLRSFVSDRARLIGCDPAGLAWCCLSAASAAIHGRIRLRMKRHDNWSVPAALWVALIGLPSTKKTPAMSAAWSPLERIQAKGLVAHKDALARWERLPKDEKKETPKPKNPRRLVTHDATMESLQDILANQSRGVGILRDELAGWIGSLEKYAGGKGSAADRAFALQSYNGGSFVADRVMRGTLPIDNLLTVMCGGIQPDRLKSFGDITDDGLWQRFILHVMAPGDRGLDVPMEAGDAWNGIIERLLNIAPDLVCEFTDDALAIRDEVLDRIYELEQGEVLGSKFVGFVGKLPGVWGRLCLTLHMIAAPGSVWVPYSIAVTARDLVFDVVLPTAARVYLEMGGAGGNLEATQSIAGYILTKRLERLVMSDLTSNVRACRGVSADEVRKLVSPLEAGGWLEPEKEFGNTKWLVSAFVHERFADRAHRETERRKATREMILSEASQRRNARNQESQEYDE